MHEVPPILFAFVMACKIRKVPLPPAFSGRVRDDTQKELLGLSELSPANAIPQVWGDVGASGQTRRVVPRDSDNFGLQSQRLRAGLAKFRR